MEDGEFAAIVAPLEEASGIELENGGRALCFRDWRRDPEGFRRCAAKALAEGEVPVRLLVYWIKKRSARQSSEPSARRRGRKSGPCSSCGSVPLEQDERLIIVEKELGKALSKGEDSCGICNKPLRPGTKGTIGELGRRNPKFLGPDDEEFVIAWTHVECFKEERPPFCPECHVGGGRHDDDCKLVTGKR